MQKIRLVHPVAYDTPGSLAPRILKEKQTKMSQTTFKISGIYACIPKIKLIHQTFPEI